METRITLKCFIAVLIAGSALAQDVMQPGQLARGSAAPSVTAASNRYIVIFTPGASQADRASAAVLAGAAVRHNYGGMEAIAVTVPNANVLDVLRRHPRVARVVPDFVVGSEQKSSGKGGGKGGPPPPVTFDTRQVISNEVQRVGMPSTGSDGTGFGIALLDSGIDFNHPDLAPAPNASSTSFNALSPGSSCQDDGGHGTHIAGLIAAQNNDIGIVGVAPAATLYCVKVLGADLTGTDSDVMAGLDWVIQNHNLVAPPIRIVNLSLGRPLGAGETIDNSPLRPLIQALYNQGIVVVAAAGNNPNVEVSQVVPSGFPEVVSVASSVATNGVRTCLLFGDPALGSVAADTASGFTTDGPGVTISAPGEERSDIVTLGSLGCVGLEYGTLSTTLNTVGATRKLVPSLLEARGSSFSAGLVSGIVARVFQKQLVSAAATSATVEGVRSWIQTNASRIGAAPLDHPWAGVIYLYTFDGVREGIAQAPK